MNMKYNVNLEIKEMDMDHLVGFRRELKQRLADDVAYCDPNRKQYRAQIQAIEKRVAWMNTVDEISYTISDIGYAMLTGMVGVVVIAAIGAAVLWYIH